MINILVAPNSFKECADSLTIAELFISNLSRSIELSFPQNRGCKEFNLISKPVSDGGDGFLRVCQKNFGLEIIYYNIPAPYRNKYIKCPVGYNKVNKILYIESAKVLGLNLIPVSKRHPLILSSRGLGVLINKIIFRRFQRYTQHQKGNYWNRWNRDKRFGDRHAF